MHNSKSFLLWVFAIAVLLWPAFVFAAPVIWSSNGHTYDLIDAGGIDWNAAKAEAESEDKMYMGVSGYLVTITSQAEQDFLNQNLFSTLADSTWGFYLGGYKVGNDPDPKIGWNWVTGESWGEYTNWRSGEPSNTDGIENAIAAEFVKSGVTVNGWWNDRPDGSYVDGYVVEYNVPEPATMSLLAFGCLFLVQRRRK